MPSWLKITLKVIAGFVSFVLLLCIGTAIYISYNKARFLKLVNTELFKNVNGVVLVGDMSPQFIKGFPNISLKLKDVVIRDKRYARHHHTLLNARELEVTVNARHLINGIVDIQHIGISNTAVDLYTDSTGYSNTSVFAKKSTKSASPTERAAPTLNRFSLSNISLKITDQKNGKLFDFTVNDVSGKMAYPDSGWNAKFNLDVLVKSMAFSTTHGSFIKDKKVQGNFSAGFDQKTGNISVNCDEIKIGEDPFKLKAVFAVTKPSPTFRFDLTCNNLLWRHASALLTPNITQKLNQFNVIQPMDVNAIISGSFAVGGDPYLYITAAIKNSTITLPGDQIDNCTFNGIFTNSYHKGQPLGDENSIIKLIGLKGKYFNIPFQIDTGSIINLIKPIATGNFKTDFGLANLNRFVDKNMVVLKKGTAQVNLQYRADIVDYQINKPFVAGNINIKGANINYVPSGLDLKNVSASLSFVKNDLLLKNIAVQTGRSSIVINGQMNNFMNFYYTAPEKILFNCSINSQQIYLGEFIGFLNDRKHDAGKRNNSGNAIKQISELLVKCKVAIKLKANNVHYDRFLATDVKADIRTAPAGVIFNNIALKTSDGSVQLNGGIKHSPLSNRLAVNATIADVNVRDFFYRFYSFGLKDLTYENLRGSLSAKANIVLDINNKAALMPRTLNGNVAVSLKNAALLNFKALQGVIKLAFPFRNLNTINVRRLDANFAVNGDKIEISPMQISSSVLNVDVAGTYGLTNGTNLTFDVPLRNPKGDSTITDNTQLQKKRYRGIVLHLRAKSDETGKLKIGFNKD